LIEASRLVDALFMKQLWRGNPDTWAQVQQDSTPLGKARRAYYWMNKGPFSRLDDCRSFLSGPPPRKPLGANFYPEDLTREELESWVEHLPSAEQKEARGFFTVIRRGADGKLTVVPYSKEYAAELAKMAALLRKAAQSTDNATLKTFLLARADALLSNDYFASDVAWMDVDAPIDLTFGPYETYNDELFGYKAAFEAYVNLRDDAETARLAAFSKHLQEIEDHLPIPAEQRNPKLGSQAPIRVVQQVFAAGDAAHGVKTAAYNLPNDERVVVQKGSKRVMLKNVQEAKFKTVLVPIAQRVLAASEQRDVAFEPFFTHILAHELSHGLGPQQIRIGDRATTPRAELKDLSGATEEAKADVVGLFALQFLMDHAERLQLKGLLHTGEKAERQLYTTFMASAFRTLRFGMQEAHGKGMALQLGYLMDKKAVLARPDGTFAIDLERFKASVKGDRPGTQKMFERFAALRPEVKKALAGLDGIPTDIEPLFVTADGLAPPR